MLGIGGGGDAVGSIAVAHWLAERGVESVLGGVAWERFVVDPYPGPRGSADIRGGTTLGDGAVIVEPPDGATTPEGVHFCESRLASAPRPANGSDRCLRGPRTGLPAGSIPRQPSSDCDLVFLVDIGGDAIADGSEPGLASPLCDAVMIAAGSCAWMRLCRWGSSARVATASSSPPRCWSA